jgi:hypothetical protein
MHVNLYTYTHTYICINICIFNYIHVHSYIHIYLYIFIYVNRVLEWVEKVSKWPIQRIIPSHYSNDIKASSKDFKKAFDFLLEKKTEKNIFENFLNIFSKDIDSPVGDINDLALLTNISELLTTQGVLFPEAPLINRK